MPMAEESVNKANAAAFLSAYNKVDAQLRALYNFGGGAVFYGHRAPQRGEKFRRAPL